MTTMITRSYSEMRRFETFEERYEYLRLGGMVGEVTFGFDRYVNQAFYKSSEWQTTRNGVILRDNGCDLGVRGHEINGSVLVHHMNPVEVDDILDREDWLLNPDFLITTTQKTHNAIHYGDKSLLPQDFVERRPGDTKLW